MRYADFLRVIDPDLVIPACRVREGSLCLRDYDLLVAKEQAKSTLPFTFTASGDNILPLHDLERYGHISHRVGILMRWLGIIKKYLILPEFKFSVALDDMTEDPKYPVLSYHKQWLYENVILIPDFEIFEKHYYCEREYVDTVAFNKKNNRAIFYGSTTGTNWLEDRPCCNTLENIQKDPSVRIEAAQFFYNSDDVIFRLPAVVQCDSPLTADSLLAKKYTQHAQVDWQTQFNEKFIISVDGNGPTCSRVAIALLSNSVLLKYKSRWITYYHRHMVPWVDYVPIEGHEGVVYVLGMLNKNMALYEGIAYGSRKKFAEVFAKPNVDRQFAAAINELYGVVAGHTPTYWSNRGRIDSVSPIYIEGHESGTGNFTNWPRPAIVAANEKCLEGFTLWPSNGAVRCTDIRYRVQFLDGAWSDEVHAGHYCGTTGRGMPICGVSIEIIGRGHVFYQGRFMDGSVQESGDGDAIRADVPLQSLEVRLDI